MGLVQAGRLDLGVRSITLAAHRSKDTGSACRIIAATAEQGMQTDTVDGDPAGSLHCARPTAEMRWRRALQGLLGLAILQLFLALPCAAAVYQCVGSDGSRSYSDAPCGPTAKAMQIQGAASAIPTASSGPQIQSALYASPRNRRALDVTAQLRSTCQDTPGACTLICGNQLAGDPDFGQTKYCSIRYRCGEAAHELQISEGQSTTLVCSAPAPTATDVEGSSASTTPPNPAVAGPAPVEPPGSVVTVAGPQAASTTYARLSPRSSAGFAYYVLSFYWRATLCAEHPQADQCRVPGQNGWVLNGLWPHTDYASPVRCAVHLAVPDAVIQSMADLFPTRALVEQEWAEHGSCTGLDPRRYFETVRRAYESIKLPAFSYANAPLQRREYDLERDFRFVNQGLEADFTCTNDSSPKLAEARVCLAQDLSGLRCSGDVILSSCRAAYMAVPSMIPGH